MDKKVEESHDSEFATTCLDLLVQDFISGQVFRFQDLKYLISYDLLALDQGVGEVIKVASLTSLMQLKVFRLDEPDSNISLPILNG